MSKCHLYVNIIESKLQIVKELIMSEVVIEQLKSKKRVADHGEVFTHKREVTAMLDLVKQETERIESRFLEPACGVGNFLTEILSRKLEVVANRYKKNQIEYERYSLIALTSIYGIDILEDNINECRDRLLALFIGYYEKLFQNSINLDFLKSAKYILCKNITWGDALTLKKVDSSNDYIVFSEWSPVNGSMIKRRDFTFHGLLQSSEINSFPLFSDLGEDVFIPEPVKDYPLTHYLRLSDAE